MHLIPFSSVRARQLALALLGALAAVLAIGLGPGAGTAAANHFQAGNCKGANAKQGAKVARLQNATRCLINRYRGRQGLRRLAEHRELKKVAKRHSNCLVRNKPGLTHTCAGTLATRVARTNYPRSSWLGENVAWGKNNGSTPLAIVNGWIHSAAHNAILRHTRFRHVGVGVAKGSPFRGENGGATYTATFGGPA